jgi:hypothetical protein
MRGMTTRTGKRPRLPLGMILLGALGACDRAPQVADASAETRLLETPAAEDSIGPKLATAPDGTVVLSWLEPQGAGHALRFSRWNGERWAPPETVASGEGWFDNWADIPSVVPIDAQLWGAHWLAQRGGFGEAYDIRAAISTDGGRSWSAPVTPHADDTDTPHGFVSMFADAGGVGLVWLDGRKYVNDVTDDVAASGMTLRAARIAPDLSVTHEALIDDLTCDCCRTDVALTSEGVVAVYRNRTENEIRDIYVARLVDGAWQPGRAVDDDDWEIDGCPVNGPVIEANGASVAVAWFTAPNDQARIEAAWSTDAGKTFSRAIEVTAERPLGHVTASMLPDGDLAVGWERTSAAGGTELCLRRVSAAGELGPIQVVEQATDVYAFGVPTLARRGGDLIVAWTGETDDKYHVESAVVPLAVLK